MKKAAVGIAAAWVAPVVLSSPAGAGGSMLPATALLRGGNNLAFSCAGNTTATIYGSVDFTIVSATDLEIYVVTNTSNVPNGSRWNFAVGQVHANGTPCACTGAIVHSNVSGAALNAGHTFAATRCDSTSTRFVLYGVRQSGNNPNRLLSGQAVVL